MMQMLNERWQHFSQRERLIVAGGGALVAAALVFVMIIDPLMTSIDKLDRQAKRKSKDSQELALVAQEYVAKQTRIAKLEQRMPSPPAQFSLLAERHGCAARANLQSHQRLSSPSSAHGTDAGEMAGGNGGHDASTPT